MKNYLILFMFLNTLFCHDDYLALVEVDDHLAEAFNLSTRQIKFENNLLKRNWPARVRKNKNETQNIVALTSGVFKRPNLKVGQLILERQKLGFLIPAVSEDFYDLRADYLEVNIKQERLNKENQRLKSLLKDGSASKKELLDNETEAEILESKKRVLEKHLSWLSGGASPQETHVLEYMAPSNLMLENILVSQSQWVEQGELLFELSNANTSELEITLSPNYLKEFNNIFEIALNDLRTKDFWLEGGDKPKLVAKFTQKLIQGSTYNLNIYFKAASESLCLRPFEILKEGSDALVFLKLGSDDYALKKVSLGQEREGCLEVASGLKAGDLVVSNGLWQLYLLARGGSGGDAHGHAH